LSKKDRQGWKFSKNEKKSQKTTKRSRTVCWVLKQYELLYTLDLSLQIFSLLSTPGSSRTHFS